MPSSRPRDPKLNEKFKEKRVVDELKKIDISHLVSM
jgi:hypothetical protein